MQHTFFNTYHTNQTETVQTHTNKAQSFKTVFLGDSNVGKTCLAKLFVERRVLDHSTNTIGFDHHVKEIEIDGGVKVKVRFTAYVRFIGRERETVLVTSI